MASQLTSANLAKLDKLDKSTRMEVLLEESSKLIDSGGDARQLLSRLQQEIEASSSARPRTGQSGLLLPRPQTGQSIAPSIAGSLGSRIQESLVSQRSSVRRPPTALSQRVRQPTAAELLSRGRQDLNADELESQFRERLSTAGSRRPVTGESQASRPPKGTSQASCPPTGASRKGELDYDPAVYCPPIIDYMQIVPEELKEKFRQEYRDLQAERREMAEAEALRRHLEQGDDVLSSATTDEVPHMKAQPPLAEEGNADKYKAQLMQMQLGNRACAGGSESASLSMLQTGGGGGSRAAAALPRQGRKHVSSRAAASSIGSILSGIDEQ